MSDPRNAQEIGVDVQLVERNLVLVGVAGVVSLAMVLALHAVLPGDWLTTAALWVLVPPAWVWTQARPASARRRLTVTRKHLLLDTTPIAVRRSLRSGVMTPTSDGRTVVRLSRRWLMPALEFVVRDAFSGERILDALGLDETRHIASFDLLRWHSSRHTVSRHGVLLLSTLLLTVPIFLLTKLLNADPAVILMALLPFALMAAFLRSALHVAKDGLTLRWAWRTRFVHFSEVATVAINSGVALTLTLTSGEVLTVVTTPPSWNHATKDVVHAYIERAFAAYRDQQITPGVALEKPTGAETLVWVKRLRTIGSGMVTYRDAVLPLEQLWRIAENPAMPVAARAAAAIALSGREADDQARGRLLRIADTTASKELRGLVSAVADARAEDDYVELLDHIEFEDEHIRSQPQRL